MQIVIDIPENDYNHIRECYEKNEIVEATYSYIYHGIILPERHGDLVDKDAFERRCMFDVDIEDMQDVIYALRDYPTILEARKVKE